MLFWPNWSQGLCVCSLQKQVEHAYVAKHVSTTRLTVPTLSFMDLADIKLSTLSCRKPYLLNKCVRVLFLRGMSLVMFVTVSTNNYPQCKHYNEKICDGGFAPLISACDVMAASKIQFIHRVTGKPLLRAEQRLCPSDCQGKEAKF